MCSIILSGSFLPWIPVLWGTFKNWARLIQKIYEVDPLTCPKCLGTMQIISFIEDREVTKTPLKYRGLWWGKHLNTLSK
jgi:hypothetical protein